MSTKESQIKSENSVNDLFQKCRDLEYDLQELLSQYKPVKKRIKVLQNRYRIELGTSKDKFKKDDLYVFFYFKFNAFFPILYMCQY